MLTSILIVWFYFCTFTFNNINGDLLYLEGFYNGDRNNNNNLPGGYNDTRNTTTIPLHTDTNRYSDGMVTTSAFESISPHFPYYAGANANVSDRYLHYTRYQQNAAEQGVSLYGAGDQVIEAAKLKITSQPGYKKFPRPSLNFTVYAAIKWNPSDFAIQVGETYNITVFGSQNSYSSQFWNDGGIRVNSQGYASYFDAVSNCYVGMGRCRPHLKKKRRLPTANWMSLGCGIGEFVRALTEIEPGKESESPWMPLDESALIATLFDVGQTIQFTAVYSGQLICFANDAHVLYWNNYGQIEVTVTRVSWPPTNTTVYEAELLPACDSAQVVYQVLQLKQANASDTYVPCNANGGGSGWTEADINSVTAGYGSGAPSSVLLSLPPYAVNN